MTSCKGTSVTGKSNRPRLSLLVAAVFLCLCGAGCTGLEVSGISYVVRFPRKGKVMECLGVYEDLHVNGGKRDDLESARRELTMHANDPTFRRGLFISALMGPLKSLHDPCRCAESERLVAAVHDQLEVSKVTFYRDKKGKLCGRDTWRISDREKFVDSINRLLAHQIEQGATHQLAAHSTARARRQAEERRLAEERRQAEERKWTENIRKAEKGDAWSKLIAAIAKMFRGTTPTKPAEPKPVEPGPAEPAPAPPAPPAPRENRSALDDETLTLQQHAARSRYVWFRCEPGLLQWRFPATAETFRNLQKEWSRNRDNEAALVLVERDGAEVKITWKETDSSAIRLLGRQAREREANPLDEGLVLHALALNNYWLPQRDTDAAMDDFAPNRAPARGWVFAAVLCLTVILAAVVIRRRQRQAARFRRPPFAEEAPARIEQSTSLRWFVRAIVCLLTVLVLAAAPCPLLVAAWPSLTWTKAAEVYLFWPVSVCVVVLGLAQVGLLFGSSPLRTNEVTGKRYLSGSALAASFLMGVLSVGLFCSLGEWKVGPRRTLEMLPLFLALGAAVFVCMALFLWNLSRSRSRTQMVVWPCWGLLLCALAALLLAAPAHGFARTQTLRGGGIFTTLGLAASVSVLLTAYLPSVVFFFAARWPLRPRSVSLTRHAGKEAPADGVLLSPRSSRIALPVEER
jgi:hypothetical protein